MKPIISFLIPAHNEERFIGRALEKLQAIQDPGFEVLVGLDNCTDRTEEIVGTFPFAKIFHLQERKGKQAVLEKLLKEAVGEIIIIHDADWTFHCKPGGLGRLISSFDNPQAGGIVLPSKNQPYPGTRDFDKLSLAFCGEAWCSFFLTEFQFANHTLLENGLRVVDRNKVHYPFFVDIYRKKACGDVFTAGDDIERCLQILGNGYQLGVVSDPEFPYFLSEDIDKTLKDMYVQRVRGHLARNQVKGMYKYSPSFSKFYLPFSLYSLKNLYRVGSGRCALGVVCWFLITGLSVVQSALARRKTVDSKDAWLLRAKR